MREMTFVIVATTLALLVILSWEISTRFDQIETILVESPRCAPNPNEGDVHGNPETKVYPEAR